MINVVLRSNYSRNSVIVPENQTIRKIFEDNEVDYSVGTVTLDSFALKAGDMDKSLADFGVTEKCFLAVSTKSDGASSVTIIGNSIVFVSSHSLDDIKLVEKYDPDKLCIYKGEDKDKKMVFKVATEDEGCGSINKYGVVFGPATTAAGMATVSIAAVGVESADNAVDEIEDEFGAAISYLDEVEAGLDDALTSIAQKRNAVRAHINVM